MLYDIELTSNAEPNVDFNFNVKKITGAEMVEQTIKIVLSLWRGEWFADSTLGMPWPEVLKNRFTSKMLIDEIEKALKKIPVIDRVDSIFLLPEGRELKIEYIVTANSEVLSGAVVI